jgi:hypothetical protein
MLPAWATAAIIGALAALVIVAAAAGAVGWVLG